jgi:hypothetical protein
MQNELVASNLRVPVWKNNTWLGSGTWYWKVGARSLKGWHEHEILQGSSFSCLISPAHVGSY